MFLNYVRMGHKQKANYFSGCMQYNVYYKQQVLVLEGVLVCNYFKSSNLRFERIYIYIYI